jgi:tetratricopeptide (TPR) repeat protein
MRDEQELSRLEGVRALPSEIVIGLAVSLRRLDALDEAIALSSVARDRHPDDFWVNLELATELALVARTPEDWARAENAQGAALALCGRSPLVSLYHGVAEYDAGRREKAPRRYKRAVDAYHKAIAIDRSYAPAWCNLGNAYTALREWKHAEDAFHEAIRLEPDYALAHFDLAVAFDQQRKFEEAMTSYRRAAEIDQGYAQPLINLGLVEYDLGRYAGSAKDLGLGVGRLEPGDPDRADFLYSAGSAAALAAGKAAD